MRLLTIGRATSPPESLLQLTHRNRVKFRAPDQNSTSFGMHNGGMFRLRMPEQTFCTFILPDGTYGSALESHKLGLSNLG